MVLLVCCSNPFDRQLGAGLASQAETGAPWQVEEPSEGDSLAHCIDPQNPTYRVLEDQITVGWGGPQNDRFSKTVAIRYHNTLSCLVLEVMSTHGIADVLMNDVSIKDFAGTVPPGVWQEISLPLEPGWEASDVVRFELKITGFGPPAYFSIEYSLAGPCAYLLTLAASPPDSGTVTGGGLYATGEPVQIAADANDGWAFTHWADEDGNMICSSASCTYTMPGRPSHLTAYFEEFFVCGLSTVTDADGNEYTTVPVGDQCWMAENLRYLPAVTGPDDWSTTEARYYVYDYDGEDVDEARAAASYAIHGVLYNWPAALEACPVGWHLPDDEEWIVLESSLGMSSDDLYEFGWRGTDQGSMLKSTTGWYEDGNGTNTSLFSAHPSGHWNPGNRRFFMQEMSTDWWSSTAASGQEHSIIRNLQYDKDGINRIYRMWSFGFSVRCIRDDE